MQTIQKLEADKSKYLNDVASRTEVKMQNMRDREKTKLEKMSMSECRYEAVCGASVLSLVLYVV